MATQPEKAKRRARGDGGLYWDESRQRWTAEATVGYRPNGRRIVRRGRGITKTEAKNKLKEILEDIASGQPAEDKNYTVADAMREWMQYGLPRRSEATREKVRILVQKHIVDIIGGKRLADLSADDVDSWLADRAKTLATRSLRDVLSYLRRAISRAQAREKVRRNVVLLCEVPEGRSGRPSKSLTLPQAEALLSSAEGSPLRAYVVLSLLTGARTEELRALTWDHVELTGTPDADPPIPPHMRVWHSVREKGDTKTRKSRRSLALPRRCVDALRSHATHQGAARRLAGQQWTDHGLVFASAVGTPLDAANVRRAFRRVAKRAGLDGTAWTPRELRHSFVSLLSDSGMPLEQIARLVGHDGTGTTERVYRHQLRPIIEHGTDAMDRIFGEAS